MTEQNPRKLLSLVALIYFPFIISFLTKDSQDEYSLDENDMKIILTYQKAWYFLIVWTIITIILFILSFYYSFNILWFLTNILVIFFLLYLFLNIFMIFSDKAAILFTSDDIKKININKVNSWNIFYILSYLPFVNFYLYSSKNYSQEQEYWLKEATLLYFIWSFIGLLSMFFSWFIWFFYFILLFVIIRSMSLFFGVDFFPDSFKKYIYNSYKETPIELFSYICALFYFLFHSLYLLLKWKRLLYYWKYLYITKNALQKKYELNSILKKPKKYISLILSYIVFIILFVYLLYKAWQSFYTFVYIFSIFIFVSYIVIIYYNNKKITPIPIITSSLSYIVNKFI